MSAAIGVAGRLEQRALREALLDGLLDRPPDAVAALALGVLAGGRRRDPDRGIEQDGALDPLRMRRGELHQDPAAVAVADPAARSIPSACVVSTRSATCAAMLHGGSQPDGAVAPEVDRDDPEARREPPLGERPVAARVAGDAVQADDRRRARVAPLVRVQDHHVRLLACSRCCTTSTGTCRPSRPCSTTRSRRAPTASSWAATTASGGRGRRRRSSGSSRCRRPRGSAATPTARCSARTISSAPTARTRFTRNALGREQIEWLHALPERVAFGGELFCHASPLSDEETFGPEPGLDDERLLAGEHRRLIVFGHSHVQFRRPGPAADGARQPGQRRDPARRRPPRRLGAAEPGRRDRAAPHRLRQRRR